MIYEKIQSGIFLDRPNRFIAHVELDGKTEICHVKNTGRCRELLVPGTTVYCQEHDDPSRKTRYSLITVDKAGKLINMDSQVPNKVVLEAIRDGKLFKGVERIKPEARFGQSRLDFLLQSQNETMYIEVKGVTLEENGAVFFPDAPTLRGVRHLNELSEAVLLGYGAAVIFVIQMGGIRYFAPNWKTDPDFALALQKAESTGVKVLAFNCNVSSDSIALAGPVPIILDGRMDI